MLRGLNRSRARTGCQRRPVSFPSHRGALAPRLPQSRRGLAGQLRRLPTRLPSARRPSPRAQHSGLRSRVAREQRALAPMPRPPPTPPLSTLGRKAAGVDFAPCPVAPALLADDEDAPAAATVASLTLQPASPSRLTPAAQRCHQWSPRCPLPLLGSPTHVRIWWIPGFHHRGSVAFCFTLPRPRRLGKWGS